MNSNILTYRVIIKKDGKNYHAFVPSLPGCHSYGKTIDEAKLNIREAITGYLNVANDQCLSIPKEDGIESIETFDLTKVLKNYPATLSYA